MAAARIAPPLLLAALVVAAMVIALASSLSGAVDIPLRDVPRLLWGAHEPADQLWRRVLIEIRLPRVLFGLLAGAALAVTGAAMQALFRNPLADPGLIGISMGGAAGAICAIVLIGGGLWVLAPAAFAGSLAAAFAAYTLGRRYAGVAGLLLAGIAINVIASSVIGLMILLADDAQLRDLNFWTLGSLAGASWPVVAAVSPGVLILCCWLATQWRVMNALLLGEREAQHLGFALKSVRRRLLLATTLIVGLLVAVTGGIAFVGLVVPHVIRMALGANHRWLLPCSMAAGAVVLALADWLARVAIVPSELPIGLVTSLVGGPFFLWLLVRARSL